MNENPDLRSAAGSSLDRAAFSSSYISWSPTFAGGLVAAAVFFVLISFAVAIGLAVSSVSPTWRDTSVGLVVLSGAWVVLVAVGSSALGGYIVGRMRSSWRGNADEIHFRDGIHGLLVWSIAVIIGVGLTWASTATLNESTSKINAAGSERTAASSTASEPSFLTFEIDRLLWSQNRTQTPDAETRAEAGRILEKRASAGMISVKMIMTVSCSWSRLELVLPRRTRIVVWGKSFPNREPLLQRRAKALLS